jgi:hypothetical protein
MPHTPSVTIRTLACCAILLALAAASAGRASAQETRATITGTVKDTRGAVVPGVTVTVLNTVTPHRTGICPPTSASYGGPNTDPTSASFGVVSVASQVNFPRTTQVGLRFTF